MKEFEFELKNDSGIDDLDIECPLGVDAAVGSAHCKMDCPNFIGINNISKYKYHVLCEAKKLED